MGKTAVIAGAGPVGALAAILLAKQGYEVQVFDKRPLPERVPPRTDRKAYLLNLNPRALQAFKLADIKLEQLIQPHNGAIETIFRRANGKVRHSFTLEVPKTDPVMLRVFRDEIARHLIDEAKRLYPKAITFTFEAALVSVDFSQQTAHFAPKGKLDTEVHYNLLVGADGAASVVREQLQKVLQPDFMRKLSHSIVYATGPVEEARDGEFPKHTFMDVHPFQAGSVMVYARGDGDRRVGLFLGKPDAARVSAGDTKWLLQQTEAAPGLAKSAKQATKALAESNPEFQKMAGWTYLSQLHGPKTLLVGDAAHTMTPVLGQGCNSGLEDVAIFTRLLEESGGDVDKALPAFTAARLPDIRALIQLNEIAADERARFTGDTLDIWHRLFVSSHSFLMTLHMGLNSALHKALPSIFDRPALQRALLGALKFRYVRPAMYWDLALVSSIAVAACAAGYASYARLRS